MPACIGPATPALSDEDLRRIEIAVGAMPAGVADEELAAVAAGARGLRSTIAAMS